MRNRKRRRLTQESQPDTQESATAPVIQEENLPEPEETTEEAPKSKSWFKRD